MAVAFSLFIIAIGAIFRYAITRSFSGLDLGMVGMILMVTGIVGLIIALFKMFIDADSAKKNSKP
jgi:hypothetical protein